MIEASKLEGKTLVFLKPCDTYSFNQLIREHRVDRDKAYIIGVGCKGKLRHREDQSAGHQGHPKITDAEISDECENTYRGDSLRREERLPIKTAMLGAMPCL